MEAEKPFSFDLSEISKWQLDFENSKVELPALQRGFVWKANQIESLWDSILRGFPIGSFLLSKSEDEKLFLLDGQQRATSIAIGYYDPWHEREIEKSNFWSLKKNIPIVWIDLKPQKKTNTQKYVIRVVTQSHPWGYQRVNHNVILGIEDRRNALKIFQENLNNKNQGYIHLSPLNVFPYDADLPVPLPFLIKSITENRESWKEKLIYLCKENLPINLKTKYFGSNTEKYIERLAQILLDNKFDSLYTAIINIGQIEIPGIIIKKEILKDDDEQGNGDEQSSEDPTLFVRLNSSGTRIAGEELIYSIYKASFPQTKQLVENIGASFVAPSLVISLIARLASAEVNENNYPYPISVNDFRKRIKNEDFKKKLKELIGDEIYSPAKLLFDTAIDLLRSKNFAIPPVLVKNIVKHSPDLFLMLLQWIKLNNNEVIDAGTIKKILATITSLSWFGRNNAKYVQGIWGKIHLKSKFWEKEVLSIPFFNKRDFIMYPLIQPLILREYLLQEVVENKVLWDNLYPTNESEIAKIYKEVLSFGIEQENEIKSAIDGIWDNFMNKLFNCKSLILFAQREYINDRFGEFNQMETLEDTNTPWDWDHIYPTSWVYGKWNINHNTRRWTNAIGNFRAISLEENRSENNALPPQKRLMDVKKQSFIKENDWEYWNKISARINDDNNEMIKVHLKAIVNRLCNIYEEWYYTLDVGELFDFKIS